MGLSLCGLSHGGILGLLPASEGLPAQPGLLQREEPLYRRKRHRRREALSVALRGDAPLFQVQFTDLAGLGNAFLKRSHSTANWAFMASSSSSTLMARGLYRPLPQRCNVLEFRYGACWPNRRYRHREKYGLSALR